MCPHRGRGSKKLPKILSTWFAHARLPYDFNTMNVTLSELFPQLITYYSFSLPCTVYQCNRNFFDIESSF